MSDRTIATFPRRSKTGGIEELRVSISDFVPPGKTIPVRTIGVRVWYLPLDKAEFLPGKVGVNLKRAELPGVLAALQKIADELSAETEGT